MTFALCLFLFLKICTFVLASSPLMLSPFVLPPFLILSTIMSHYFVGLHYDDELHHPIFWLQVKACLKSDYFCDEEFWRILNLCSFTTFIAPKQFTINRGELGFYFITAACLQPTHTSQSTKETHLWIIDVTLSAGGMLSFYLWCVENFDFH